MVTSKGNKTTLGELIINEANSKAYGEWKGKGTRDNKGRFVKTEEEFNAKKTHHDICVKLRDLSQEHNNFPLTLLVYFAVSTQAHRQHVFEKGYTSINEKKAEKILKWLDKFAKKGKNQSFATCGNIAHAFAKFYDTFSKQDKDFNRALKEFPFQEGYKPTSFKRMDTFYNLFTEPFDKDVVVIIDDVEERVTPMV